MDKKISEKLRTATGMCLDFDGVFYPHHGVPEIGSLCDTAIIQSVRHLLPMNKISDAALIEMSRKSYADHGASVIGVANFFIQSGDVQDGFLDDLYRQFNHLLVHELHHRYPELFAMRVDLMHAFQTTSQQGIKHGIASHGCHESYVHPHIAGMGISHFFSQGAIKSLHHSRFAPKHDAPEMVGSSFTGMGISPDTGIYVEDTLRNLEHYKSRHPETVCVYTHHGNPLAIQPAFVDIQVCGIPELAKAIVLARSELNLILT